MKAGTDSKGNIIGRSQMPVNPSPAQIIQDILRGKTAHQAICTNLGTLMLEESENRSSDNRSNYKSETKGHWSENCASEDEMKMTSSPAQASMA